MRVVVLAVGVLVLMALPAQAVTLGFFNITGNDAVNAGTAGQYTVDVTASGGGVNFQFNNAGPAASSITDVYFDDGTLLAIASITNGSGVDFAQLASPPDLPGGNAVGFSTTDGFSADSNPPAQPNGVNPGETLGILFTLQNTKTFADTIAALTDGSLRIGIHVQGFANGGSESFVNNPVPEPATMFLLGAGLFGVGAWARRRLAQRHVVEA